MSPFDQARNLSMGLGRAGANVLEGFKQLGTEFGGRLASGQSAGEAAFGVGRQMVEPYIEDPGLIVEQGQEMLGRAASGPLGFGEVVGEFVNPFRTPRAPKLELDVYHGSPHRFEEFDASKIGTGEGQQAYGHGIYVAEQKDVADMYRRALTPHQVSDNDAQSLASYAMRQRHNKDDAIKWLQKEKTAYKSEQSPETLAQYDAAINVLQGGNVPKVGNLYTADLPDEMVDRMLDWDKPLSEQPALLKTAEKLKNDYLMWDEPVETATGRELYEALEAQIGSKEAAAVMKGLNIPGIRYLDAGSRGQGGTGTRNFVVFPGEEKNVKILKRE
jgi:hypothetical protein